MNYLKIFKRRENGKEQVKCRIYFDILTSLVAMIKYN